MRSAAARVTREERQKIAEAVADAEARTSAEIVPVVASASGRYDRAEDLVGLWFAALALSAVWLVAALEHPEPGSWGSVPMVLEWILLLAALVGGFIAGVVAANRIGWLRRLCTPAAQMTDEVAARARQLFFDERIYHTKRSSGLLLYVSLYERQAVLLADEAVLAALDRTKLDELARELTDRIKRGGVVEGLLHAIREAADRLEGPLPRRPEESNQLSDALVTID